MLCVFQPLLVVTVQQFGVGVSADGQRDFPGQVITVLNTRVHSLGAGRRVSVRGVAREKTAACRKLICVTRMDLVRREPLDIKNVQIELAFGLDSGLNLSYKMSPSPLLNS